MGEARRICDWRARDWRARLIRSARAALLPRRRKWVRLYALRIHADGRPSEERQAKMRLASPKYVPREWMLVQAYRAAQEGDYSVLHTLVRAPRHARAQRAPLRAPRLAAWADARPARPAGDPLPHSLRRARRARGQVLPAHARGDAPGGRRQLLQLIVLGPLRPRRAPMRARRLPSGSPSPRCATPRPPATRARDARCNHRACAAASSGYSEWRGHGARTTRCHEQTVHQSGDEMYSLHAFRVDSAHFRCRLHG